MMNEKIKNPPGRWPGLTLSVEALMQVSLQKARLDDWGGENFQYPLGRLLNFFEEEYGDDSEKRFSFAFTVIESLAKRLYIQDNFNTHPEILEIPVSRPLFITGLPRTGTTLIHNLISRDPGWRVLLYWELLYPYHREDIGNFEQYAINLVEQGLKALYSMRPEFIYRHETTATGPEECFNLIRLTFYSIAWANEWYLTGYLKWFLQQDMTDSYRYYRKLLQLLLRRKQGQHLLLKCPAHLFTIDALYKVFPDANVVWMHRNPCKSIASGLSLLSVFHDISSGANEFLELYLIYFKKSLEKAMEIEKSGSKQLKSISYKALVQNPTAVIRDIYDWFGYSRDVEIEKNILNWLAENPQHKHGVHKYKLEDFGFTETDTRDRFSNYFDEYGDLL
jgi:hypothetical protein